MTESTTSDKKFATFAEVLPLLPQREQPPNLAPPALCRHQHRLGLTHFRPAHQKPQLDTSRAAARLCFRMGRPLFLRTQPPRHLQIPLLQLRR